MKKLLLYSVFIIIISVSNLLSQWQEINNGLYGGAVALIVVKDNYIFAVTKSAGGIYLTTNNGANWSKVNNGLNNNYINCLAFSGTTLFVGTRYDGIYRTTDYGSNWEKSSSGITDLRINCIASDGANIFVGTAGDGIFLSNDNGLTWDSVNTDLINKSVYCIAINGTNIIAGTAGYGTMGGGVFLSTNKGGNWKLLNNGLTSQDVINVIAFDGSNIFAASQNLGFFLSTNNGTSWSKLFTKPNQAQLVSSIVIKEGNIFIASPLSGTWFSTNNGANWSQIITGLTNYNINCLTSNGTTIYSGSEGSGVFQTSDTTWMKMNNTGLDEAIVNSLASDNTILYAGTVDGTFHSTDKGDTWLQVDSGLSSNNIQCLVVMDSNLLAGTYNTISGGGIFLSNNKGMSWVNKCMNWESKVSCFAIQGSNIYAGLSGGNAVIKSTDKGETWSPVNSNSLIHNKVVYCLTIKDNNIFAGTSAYTSSEGGVYFSTDNGTSWTAANTGLEAQYYTIYAITASGSNLFAGRTGLFKSANDGGNWEKLFTNTKLDSVKVNCLVTFDEYIFAGTMSSVSSLIDFGGFYMSTDYGDTWHLINTGLNTKDVRCIKVVPPYVYAGTNGGGVYRAMLSDLVLADVKDNPQSTINLYPNPANNFITINYPNNSGLISSIEIINNLGVPVIARNKFESDENSSFTINIGNLPSGIYYCLLKAGSYTEIKKFAIIK